MTANNLKALAAREALFQRSQNTYLIGNIIILILYVLRLKTNGAEKFAKGHLPSRQIILGCSVSGGGM